MLLSFCTFDTFLTSFDPTIAKVVYVFITDTDLVIIMYADAQHHQ